MKLSGIALASVAVLLADFAKAGLNDVYWYGLPTKKNGGAFHTGEEQTVIMCWERTADKYVSDFKFNLDSKWGWDHSVKDFAMHELDENSYNEIALETAQRWGEYAPKKYQEILREQENYVPSGFWAPHKEEASPEYHSASRSSMSSAHHHDEHEDEKYREFSALMDEPWLPDQNMERRTSADEQFAPFGGFEAPVAEDIPSTSNGQFADDIARHRRFDSFDNWEVAEQDIEKFNQPKHLYKRGIFNGNKDGGSIFDVPKSWISARDKNDRSRCYYAKFTPKEGMSPKMTYRIEAKRWRRLYLGKKKWKSPRFTLVKPPTYRGGKRNWFERIFGLNKH